MEESHMIINEFMAECKIKNISNNCYKMIIKQNEKMPLGQKKSTPNGAIFAFWHHGNCIQ
jgi:hypothetical protein